MRHLTLIEGPGREEDLTGALDELIGFILQHFLSEERFMEANNYPEAEAHEAEHKVLLGQARDFRARILDGDLQISSFLMQQIRAWLLEHIQAQDRALGEFLKARTPSARPA